MNDLLKEKNTYQIYVLRDDIIIGPEINLSYELISNDTINILTDDIIFEKWILNFVNRAYANIENFKFKINDKICFKNYDEIIIVTEEMLECLHVEKNHTEITENKRVLFLLNNDNQLIVCFIDDESHFIIENIDNVYIEKKSKISDIDDFDKDDFITTLRNINSDEFIFAIVNEGDYNHTGEIIHDLNMIVSDYITDDTADILIDTKKLSIWDIISITDSEIESDNELNDILNDFVSKIFNISININN